MAYSLKRLPNDESKFPAPPRWLLWYDDGTGQGQGQIRHLDTLQKAKKYVSPYGSRPFYRDWTIYEWDEGKKKYIERYSGREGQLKSDNKLFRTRVRPKKEKVRDVPDEDLAAALESIKGAVA